MPVPRIGAASVTWYLRGLEPALGWLAVVVLALWLTGSVAARVPAYTWSRKSIEVRDYTSDSGDYVARKVAEWNAVLPGNGPRLWYHRLDARENCQNVKKKRHSIVVCNMADDNPIPCDGPSSGCTTIYLGGKRHGDNVITGAKVILSFDQWPDPAGPHRDGAPYGCHELGHALGLNHDDSNGSCMGTDRDAPGPNDVAKLTKMYGR